MARKDPQFNVRMPQDLKEMIEASAKDNQRSINAEIVHHLRNAMEAAGYLGSPTPEQTDAPVSSAPPRWARLKKYPLQTDIPAEDLQELIAHIQEIWAKNKSAQDK
ncbi:Arc family DNA-binding protein [Aeromonas sp. ASNIH2]|uniref:Arc family DNA-binding protein n=1 Tax=Aeromonas sp. ASNIH2 TaxID=1636607 RepID=UPI000CDC7701|nr:Arc family DNA-binding protein [Aeromonas sp. ASNIH2]AUY11153.1 hypothetical protein C3F36_17840 [Aeromonas sp. ASNIH2]